MEGQQNIGRRHTAAGSEAATAEGSIRRDSEARRRAGRSHGKAQDKTDFRPTAAMQRTGRRL